MFGSPRVIVVDDDQRHLDGLVGGLYRSGVACLPIHFTGDTSELKACPDVRVIIADLNLIGQPSDHAAQFTTLGGLLEATIMPRGPYIILLWTRYPEQAAGLQAFLGQRLRGVARPFAVVSLAKADHLNDDGAVRDQGRLMAAITELTRSIPQIAALFDWENRVLGAAGDTVSSLLDLASMQSPNASGQELGRVLSWLGIEAVGERHMDENGFRAVNEALLPILADRIARLGSTPSEDEAWQAAVATAVDEPLKSEEAARLNRMVHVDTTDGIGPERGAVISLPLRLKRDFASCFGVDETAAAQRQFHCAGFDPGDSQFRWVLVQSQAACDYAQSRPGPTPCYLGLEMPLPCKKSGRPPAALWVSPAIELGADVRELRVSAQFPASVGPTEFRQGPVIYRLREQILNDLIYYLHSHGARPGMMSFRGR